MAKVRKTKWKIHVFGKDAYYLGQGYDGKNYFLEESAFVCNWYWSGGYVETYTNNSNPVRSRDIESHNHFDCMFLNNRRKNGYDEFKEFFAVTPFSDKEIWTIIELLNSFYIARRYADMLYTGNAHYSVNPAKETIKDMTEYDRINKKVIPTIMMELYAILGEENEDEHD